MDSQKNKEKVILVIEDERPLAEAVRLKLENSGFDVVIARTGEQAIDYLDQLSRIDAIWLDHYLLGKENGLDVVANLKADGSKWKNIPVFVVSNSSSQDKAQTYLHMGVDKYYIKAQHKLADIVQDVENSLKG